MKSWTITLGVVLLLAIVSAGVSYTILNTGINSARTEIAALQADIKSLQAGGQPATTTTGTARLSMIDLISEIQPIVVRVDVTGSGFQASGSGVIFQGDGHIITNAHVVEGATSVQVTLHNEQEYGATVVSSDSKRRGWQ